MGTKVILAAGILCVFLLNSASALKCRNGFNTTIYGMPVYVWNETYSCSSTSAQTCFLTEVKYETKFMEEEVVITYGSCVSQSYSDLLSCEKFYGEDGASLDQLMQLFPDALGQIDNVIMLLSEQVAENINETISTKNNTELIHMLLDELNITIPQNYSELFMAIMGYNSSDVKGSLEDIFKAYIEMHPEMFNGSSPFLESLPKLIMELSQNNTDYLTEWRLDLLMEYSTITNASETLSNSIIDMLARFGYDNLTEEHMIQIKYRPGLYYHFYPNHTEEIDERFYQMAAIIDMIQPMNMSDANSSKWLEDLFPMIVNKTVENLEKMNITVPTDVIEAILKGHEKWSNYSASNQTFDFEMFLEHAMMSLEKNNITLSNNTLMMLSLLPDIFEAIKSNNTDNVTALIGQLWINFETNMCVKNNITAAYAEAYYNELVGYGLNISESYMSMFECIPGYFYHRYPENETAITELFTMLTLYYNNQTEYYENIFEMYNMTLPPELLAFIQLQEDIQAANGNTTVILMLLMEYNNATMPQCISNNITQAFADAFFTDLVNSGANISESMKPALECIPSFFYMVFPDNETEITQIFMQMTLFLTNQTEYFENIFAMFNMTIPPELVSIIQLGEQITAADGNGTVIMKLLYNYANETFPPTELSMLTVTILTNMGVNVTDQMELMIRIQSSQFYLQNANNPNVTETGDIIFASLNTDLGNGVDFGVAIANAFAKTTIDIPEEIVFVLNNIQPVFDAMMINGTGKWEAVDRATLELLNMYAAEYPGSTQVEYQAAWLELRIALLYNNGTKNDTEVREIVNEIFDLTLELFNVTKDEFFGMLNETFPTITKFLEYASELEPGEAAMLGVEFYNWVTDPDRNISTLASIINETIHLVLERKGVNIRQVLEGLFEPDACKYETCDIDSCNTPNIVENATEVTKPIVTTTQDPSQTTTTKTTTQDPSQTTTAPPTTAADTSTPATTVTTPTTTSGAATMITGIGSSLLMLFSTIYSMRFVF